MARVLSPARIAAYPIDARGLLAREPSQSKQDEIDFDQVARNGDSMPAQSFQPIGDDTMQTLADETGGEAFVNTNNITGAIRQAVEDSAVTYTLGFYIDRASIDGKFHELKVHVKRKGLKVRYPKVYLALEDTPGNERSNRNSLLSAVRSPIESSVDSRAGEGRASGEANAALFKHFRLRSTFRPSAVQKLAIRGGSLSKWPQSSRINPGKLWRNREARINLRSQSKQYR